MLGFGTVGSGVYRIATENHAQIMERNQLDIEISRILIKDFETEPNLHMAPQELFTTNLSDIVSDEEIDVVVECMGGVEPARTFILDSLSAKKTVVTSNKEVFSKYWLSFETAARASGVGLYHEATVGGGIPVIRTLIDAMQANDISDVMGIINGTTNFILTKMTEEKMPFEEVLKEAQRLGYAEANPAADVEGWDATYKLSILSSMAFHAHIPIDCIYREGITRITPEDIQIANQLGYEIKLLAIGKKSGNRVQVRVHPTMIKKTHPLASVRGSFNAVFLKGHAVGDVMLYGRGAGQMPTASAVMSDVIYAGLTSEHKYSTFENVEGLSENIELDRDWESVYCIRLNVADRTGVLAAIAGVFAKHDVSLKNVLQVAEPCRQVPITFITHSARELAVQAALREIARLNVVRSVENLIRVEDQ